MNNNKIKTNFSKYTDANLDVIAGTAVKNLTANANFTFNNGELTTLTAAATKYHNMLEALVNGGKAAVIQKNAARKDLQIALNTIALQVNIQANGDAIKLQSSGLPLATVPQHRIQQAPVNLQVVNGNGSNLEVSVNVSPVGDNGTVFAYTPVTNAVANPALWILQPTNGHSATIKGLTSGVEYKFSAAYKGNDKDDLVWAPVITKFAGS